MDTTDSASEKAPPTDHPNPQESAAARTLLGYYELPGGQIPSGFDSAFVQLLERSDPHNCERLLQAFTEYRRPVEIFTSGTDGPKKLLEWLRATPEYLRPSDWSGVE